MATRQDWITQGLESLADDGLPGVRIDRIAARLGVTKGSFHHHFTSAQTYRQELLDSYEQRSRDALVQASAGGEPPLARLDRLVESLDELYDPRIEAALRAWAVHDERAREVVERLDRERLVALEEIWRAVLPDPDQARAAAMIPHLVVIGASASRGTTRPADLGAALHLLSLLAPEVAAVMDQG